MLRIIFYNSTLIWSSCSDLDCLSIIICSYKLCREWLLFPSQALSVLCGGLTSKTWGACAISGTNNERGLREWQVSSSHPMWWWFVQLTHVSLPNKLIFIIVTQVFSSGGTLDSAQTAQRCHIKELCERRFYFQWPLSSQLCLYETEEGHRGILGDTAPDINKQYSLCLAGGVVS